MTRYIYLGMMMLSFPLVVMLAANPEEMRAIEKIYDRILGRNQKHSRFVDALSEDDLLEVCRMVVSNSHREMK